MWFQGLLIGVSSVCLFSRGFTAKVKEFYSSILDLLQMQLAV